MIDFSTAAWSKMASELRAGEKNQKMLYNGKRIGTIRGTINEFFAAS
jgi:hypothetical protein